MDCVIGSSSCHDKLRDGCVALVLCLLRSSGSLPHIKCNILVAWRLSSSCGIHTFWSLCLLVLGVCLFFLSLLGHTQVPSSYGMHFARCFGACKGSVLLSPGLTCSWLCCVRDIFPTSPSSGAKRALTGGVGKHMP